MKQRRKTARIPKSIRVVQAMEIATEEITYLIEEMARQHQEREPGTVDFYTARENNQVSHGSNSCVKDRARSRSSPRIARSRF
jgi:hypothetical protein